ncbi:MAG: carbonic anhydrase family protein [Azonexus sp.]|jgi:carbonic anhydrase|nr:carbonic anhydrase family protein [Azonexus sp.]
MLPRYFPALAALFIALPLTAAAAPVWQNLSAEPGKRIELDRTSIKRSGPMVEAVSRMALDRDLIDPQSGSAYQIIEVLTRYDCVARNASTLKRTFWKDEAIVRQETLKGVELPVRSGTLDDKVLREVCRPPKDSQADLVAKANEAASALREANEALLKKERAATATPPKPAAAASGGKAAAKPPPAKPPARAAAPAKKASGGYMLEVVRHDKQKPPVEWSYEGAGGPENWARLDPQNALCGSGQRQSPIDIRDGIKVDVEPIRFNYQPSGFRIIDSGHALEVFLGANSFTLTGKTYALEQIRFHHPAEEVIAGRRYEMSAHLWHRADDGQRVVIAVLLERGAENTFIQTLWNYLPLEKHLGVEPPGITVQPDALLPVSRSYYAYMGSLTTPPCSEGVLWLVMKQPVAISAEQIDIFARLYQNNARPLQATAGRLIKEGR